MTVGQGGRRSRVYPKEQIPHPSGAFPGTKSEGAHAPQGRDWELLEIRLVFAQVSSCGRWTELIVREVCSSHRPRLRPGGEGGSEEPASGGRGSSDMEGSLGGL